jgi:hypothetical protein
MIIVIFVVVAYDLLLLFCKYQNLQSESIFVQSTTLPRVLWYHFFTRTFFLFATLSGITLIRNLRFVVL